jgi:hypothetical protein
MSRARVLPVEKELLGSRADGFAHEGLEIIGAINIQSDAAKLSNDHLVSSRARSGKMRLEAVIAEAKRNQIERATQDGVGAATI